LLARALVTPSDSGPSDDAARTVLSTLRTAKLAVPDDDVARRSSLLLILTGPRSGTDELAQAQDAILVALARALDERCDGVVVGGPPSAAREGGPIAAVRDDGQTADLVSTVDVLPLPAGRCPRCSRWPSRHWVSAGTTGPSATPTGALAPLQGLTEDQ
jgi:hypothetical protein